jgi:hypothetical protein
VTLETSGGEENEVRVPAEGSTQVVSTDAADADDSDGKVTTTEIDDDAAPPYDISVVTADGRTVELDLDADRKVLSTKQLTPCCA